jgi:hypothetical protein
MLNDGKGNKHDAKGKKVKSRPVDVPPCGKKQRDADPFFVVTPDKPSILPDIIVQQYDPLARTGFDWQAALAAKNQYPNYFTVLAKIAYAVLYLQEAIQKMTGKNLRVINSDDLSKGIVFTALAGAPSKLRNDPEIVQALQSDGSDSYNDREAFFIRSEPTRLLIIANTVDGLAAAVPELLESVSYEVLGMGPNWTYVPKDYKKSLAFKIKRMGRPSNYLRKLGPSSGQNYGVGTIFKPQLPLNAPDEPVDASFMRWFTGTRMLGQSMPAFPGHALQAYHKDIVDNIKKTGQTEGFLTQTYFDKDAKRPVASKDNLGHLWINSDPPGAGTVSGKVFLSKEDPNTKVIKWAEANLADLGVSADLSLLFVRNFVLERMKERAIQAFQSDPDSIFVFGSDPEDGAGYKDLHNTLRIKNWYPEYLVKEGVAFGQPYALHNFKGLNQPNELWDSVAPSDTVFGFNNWLLREFDKWIDSLPPQDHFTATGKPKKLQTRLSLLSYAYHDVPPNFNLDPRIRVMIASYPKHRGLGKWKNFATPLDLAQAFQKLLPKEPSGDFRSLGYSYEHDRTLEGIPARWSAAPSDIINSIKPYYEAGFKAFNAEMDFNFGKYGLNYYLLSKVLWNVNLTPAKLSMIRDTWLQRAYGSGWREMKAYYDFMLFDNFQANAPNFWARAIRLIEAADQKINDINEPDEQARLDDLKQYWYYFYLVDIKKDTAASPEMREFAWKGQMSYMTAMHMVMRQIFKVNDVFKATDPGISSGPAHYTHAETQVWWQKVLDHWLEVPVNRLADATLANGLKVKNIDLNDLVMVAEFKETGSDSGFLYNSTYQKPPRFLTIARKKGEKIGFKLFWPMEETDSAYGPKRLPYGVERWNHQSKSWELIFDKNATFQPSMEANNTFDKRRRHVVEVGMFAPTAGTYRFDIGNGGNLAVLTGLSFDLSTGKYSDHSRHMYFTTLGGLTQSSAYFYIPKGTQSLDLEVWDIHNSKTLTVYTGLLPQPATPHRNIDISSRGPHRVPLQAGEDGTIAKITGNGFAFPYLYSVPFYWAKSPAELLVPRAIAQVDGLKIIS